MHSSDGLLEEMLPVVQSGDREIIKIAARCPKLKKCRC
jgi:hypothetical protein